jgi:ATP-dependent Zn protease
VRGKNLEDTAHQEAGHAVAAWWLGQMKKRDLVTIVPDPRTGALGHLRRTTSPDCCAGDGLSARDPNTRGLFPT